VSRPATADKLFSGLESGICGGSQPTLSAALATCGVGGSLNADQYFGHRRFSSQIRSFHFHDRATWLLLALNGQLWALAGTISGTIAAGRLAFCDVALLASFQEASKGPEDGRVREEPLLSAFAMPLQT
jgi:hypothetical protein